MSAEINLATFSTPSVMPSTFGEELSDEGNMSTPIVEIAYSREQPAAMHVSVEKLLSRIPPDYLAGLDKVVLRDKTDLTRKERQHRKTQARKSKVILGLYYRQTSKRQARIELFVDEIYRRWPAVLLRIPPLRDVFIGSTLFHEIGHHIHHAVIRGHGDPEAAANEWRRKLIRHTMRRHAWYMLPILRLVYRILSLLPRRARGRES
jgi:hypothetical protein